MTDYRNELDHAYVVFIIYSWFNISGKRGPEVGFVDYIRLEGL